MPEVASAYASILPSAKGFGRSLDSQISGDIKKSGRRGGITWGKVFAIGAGFAVGAKAVRFLGDSLTEAREAEKVGARTTNIIKSMGVQSRVTAGQVSNLANAISLKTGIDDEEIQTTENLLLGFKNLAVSAGDMGGHFAQATGLATDMAAALDKTAKGGAIQLGRALEDPVKGLTTLTRAGVSFTEQQSDQVKKLVANGKLFKAQGIIIGEVKKKFGGAAAAMATPAEKARVAYQNLQEQIGTALLPVVDRFLRFLTNKVIPGISDFAKKAKHFFNQAKGPVKEFFDSIKNSDALASAIDVMANAAGRLKSGFKGAAKAVQGINFSNLDSKQVGTFLGTALADGIKKFISLAGTVTSTLVEMFSKVDWVGIGISIGKQVPALLVGLAAGFLTFDIGSLFRQMADHWQVILGAVLVIAFAPAKFAGLLGKILAKIPFVGTFLARAVVWLNELGGKVATFGADVLKTFWRGLTAGRTPGAAIVAKIMSGFRALPGAIKSFFDGIRIRLGVYALEGAEAVGKGLRTGFIAVVKFVASIPGKIFSAIGNVAKLLFPKGTAVVEGLANSIKERFAGVAQFVGGIPGRILSALGGVGRLLYSAGQDIVRGLINGIKSMAAAAAEAAISVVKSALDKAKSFLKIRSPSQVFRDEVGVMMMRGLADGIDAGGKAAEKALDTLFDRLKTKMDAQKSKLGGLLDKASALSDSVSSAFTSGLFDVSATDAVAEVRDELGNITTAAVPAKSASQNFIESLMGSKGQLKQLLAAFKTLKGAGFSPELLSQLFQSGNGALILELAADPAAASQAAGLFGEVTSLSDQLGGKVSDNKFGDKIDGVRKEIRELRKDLQFVSTAIADGVGAAINGAATTAVRRHGRRTVLT